MTNILSNAAAPKSGRRVELSWLNLIFCFMVLWSHSSGYALVHLDPAGWQYALAFSLQRVCFTSVYGFLFLSGLKLTLSRRQPPPLLSFWGKRAKSIYLPYCLAVAVYYFFYAVVFGYARLELPKYLEFLAFGNLNAHFYFTVLLMQFILLTPLMRWLAERPASLILPGAVIVTLLGGGTLNSLLGALSPGVTLQYTDRLFTNYLIYYLAGCCVGRRYERFLAILEENKKLIAGVSVCAISLDLILSWCGYALGRDLSFVGPVTMLHYLCAILLCFLIAVRLSREIPKWLASIDRAAYLIYLYHMLALQIVDRLLADLGIVRVSLHFVLRALFVYTVTPLACVLWQRLWAKIRTHRPA